MQMFSEHTTDYVLVFNKELVLIRVVSSNTFFCFMLILQNIINSFHLPDIKANTTEAAGNG